MAEQVAGGDHPGEGGQLAELLQLQLPPAGGTRVSPGQRSTLQFLWNILASPVYEPVFRMNDATEKEADLLPLVRQVNVGPKLDVLERAFPLPRCTVESWET